MADNVVGPVWGGLVWLGGGLAFHLLKKFWGSEMDSLAKAHKVSCIKELSHIAAKDGSDRERGIVVVMGNVGSESPFTGKNSVAPAVALEEYVELLYLRQVNGNTWINESKLLSSSKQHSPWYLEDSTGRLEIDGAKNAAWNNLVVASKVVEGSPPANTLRSVIDLAQGIKILCTTRVERILPVGQSLTVVGEPVRVAKDRIVVRKPQRGGPFFVSTSTLDELFSELSTASVWCKWLSIGCTVVGVGSLAVHSICHIINRRRTRRTPRPPRQDRAETRPAAEGVGESGEDRENRNAIDATCVICFERQYGVAFLPCGHVCCCRVCVEGLSQCPLCRQGIAHKTVLYMH